MGAAGTPGPGHGASELVRVGPGRIPDDAPSAGAQPGVLPAAVPGAGAVDVLLIEDDAGDALLVEDLLADADPVIHLHRAHNLAEAESELARRTSRCILLDLNLPDAMGLEGLRRILQVAPEVAVIVLTGMHDAHRGVQAVSLGAQDYLNKGEVDGPLLARAIRYAVERAETHRFRLEAELRQQENARLERGLLPLPLLVTTGVTAHTIYRPGRRSSLIGGDFYDLVETPDGTLHAVIGDVCGHGPDEAALGVCLRVAWRTLVLAGHTGAEVLQTMQRVLEHERRTEEIFATVCTVAVRPDGSALRLYSAGHPPPLVVSALDGHEAREAVASSTGPALGLTEDAEWRVGSADLPGRWGLLLFTDGLIEGRVGNGSDRLGSPGLCEIVAGHVRAGDRGVALLRAAVADAERLNGGPLADDMAALYLAGGVAR